MSSDDIRKTLSLIENLDENKDLTEAPMGFLKALTTAAASLFSVQAGEKLNVGVTANQIYTNYITYLTRIGQKPNSGRVGDLFTFLANSGNKQQAIVTGITKGTGLPIRTIEDMKKYWNTRIVTKDKLSKSIMYVVQEMSKLPEVELDPDAFAERSQIGNTMATKIDKAAKVKSNTAARDAAKKATGASSTRVEPRLFDDEPQGPLETEVSSVLKDLPKNQQTANIDAALRALGVK